MTEINPDEWCGNGRLDPGEQCDSGAYRSSVCNRICQLEPACGWLENDDYRRVFVPSKDLIPCPSGGVSEVIVLLVGFLIFFFTFAYIVTHWMVPVQNTSLIRTRPIKQETD